MRGVLKSRAPATQLVDLAHHVPRGDVRKASRVLARAAVCFPRGAVHLVVVDPGVGSARRPLVMSVGGHLFVAPDNGVLDGVSAALGGAEETRHITHPALFAATVSATFHGRDVFAPTAGALAAGFAFPDVGALVRDRVRLAETPVTETAEGWIGEVVEIDQYGNLITNLDAGDVGPRVEVRVHGSALTGPSSSYSAVDVGAAVLVVGSTGTLEIAVRDGSAAHRFGVALGDEVACSPVVEAPQSAP